MLSPKRRNPTSRKPHRIYAFDVETIGDNNDFYMGSIVSDEGTKVFYDKEEMKSYFERKQLYKSRSYIVATNLMFDFFVLYDYDELDDFKMIFRGSELILCNKKVNRFNEKNHSKRKLSFIDTYHFASKMSLRSLGKIIGYEKYPTPSYIGKMPTDEPYISMLENRKTYNQKEYLEAYNIRDSEVTYRFSRFFENSLIAIGGEMKATIASTSMNYFRLNFLDNKYTTHNHSDVQFMMNAYYGGRTEVFKRGFIENKYYYDVNSLYPSVMLNDYPDPNSLERTNKVNDMILNEYEGVCEAEVECPPNINIPLLPYRTKEKLIFPTGRFNGVFSFCELRKALSIGYRIHSLGEGIYFTRKISVFKEFIMTCYNMRLKYKKERNPIEYIFKILMNSLYGKFGQRYEEKTDYFTVNSFDFSDENVNKYSDVDVLGEFFVLAKKESTKVPSFLQPIWAVYTTAYARLKIYEYFEKVGFENVYYCDTDSLITSQELENNTEIGCMKLEYMIESGLLIKPKLYEINGKVKAKGLKGFNRKEDLLQLLSDGKYKGFKFCKFKESLRAKDKRRVNQIISIDKSIGFEDDKRNWNKPFSMNELQDSTPINI